nr:VCBS repeat-containing protein [candidate division Zixibacteria bacterium]
MLNRASTLRLIVAVIAAWGLFMTVSGFSFEINYEINNDYLQSMLNEPNPANLAQASAGLSELRQVLLPPDHRATTLNVNNVVIAYEITAADIEEIEEILPHEPITLAGSGRLARYNLATIICNPVYFDETSGNIMVVSGLSFDLESEPAKFDAQPRITTVASDRFVADNCLGYSENITAYLTLSTPRLKSDMAASLFPDLIDNTVPFVIITAPEMVSEFETYADYKTLQGYYTKVVDLDWIAENFAVGAETPDYVREFIRFAYQNWGTQYILLGASHEILPTKLIWSDKLGGDYIPSDYYYACLDGDWNENLDEYIGLVADNVDYLPEVFVGRLPVSTPSEVTNYFNKLQQYETDTQFSGYQQKSLYMGSYVSYKGDSEWIIDELDALTPSGYTPTKFLEFIGDEEQEYTKQDLIDAFNSGCSVFFAYGHSSNVDNFIIRKYYERVSFTNADADLLTNYGMYPIFSTVTCHNNDITHDCLSIHLINNPIGGAIGYIGAPARDAGYASFRYHTQMFENAYQSPVAMTIGEMTTMAHLVNASRGADIDGLSRQALLSYMYIGDPTLYVWSDAPSQFEIACPTSVAKGEQTIQITVTDNTVPVEGAMVALRYKDFFHGTALTNASGIASFTLEISSNDDITVGVTKRNYWHATRTIQVDDNTSFATLEGVSYLDDSTAVSAGNGNGMIEAGEQIAMAFTLTNTGTTDLENVVLYLANTNSDITVNTPYLMVSSIGAGETIVTDYTINFTVSETISDIQYLSGPYLEIMSNWVVIDFPLTIPIGGGVPEIGGYTIDDSEFGNDDGCLGGFEDIDFTVTVNNIGKGVLEEVWGRLIPDDPYWAIFDPGIDSIFFGDIPPMSTVTGDPFEFYFVTGDTLATYTLEFHDFYNNIYPLPIVAHCNTAVIDSILFRCYPDKIYLTWYHEDNSELSGYNLYRRTTTSAFVKVNELPITGATYYIDEGLEANTTYFYKVELLHQDMGQGPISEEYETATNPLMPNFWPGEQSSYTSAPLIAPIEPSYYYRTTFVGHQNNIYWFNCVGAPKSETCPIYAALDADASLAWSTLSGEDVNNDGKYDLFATSSGTDHKIYAFQNNGNSSGGSALSGWPVSLPENHNSMFCPVTIADVDHDGYYELFTVTYKGAVCAMNHDGTPLIGSTIDFYQMPDTCSTYSGVALGDLTGDGQLELVVTGRVDGNGLHYRYVYAFDLSGDLLPNFPVSVASSGLLSTPLLANFDVTDEGLEILVNNAMDNLYIIDADGSVIFDWPEEPFGSEEIWYSITMPSVIDVNDDGVLEIVGIIHDQLFIIDQAGNFIDGWPKTLRNIVVTDFVNNPMVGDIDGDGDFEIVLNYGSSTYAYEINGDQVPGFPISDGAGGIPALTPMISYDDLHLVCAGDEVKVWDLEETYAGAEFAWPVYGHDSHRTHNILGTKPFLYSFSCPSSIVYSHSTTVSATVLEYDERWGDELTYVWSAVRGTITGSGPSVTYNAPSYTCTDYVTLKVYDKGGNTVIKKRTISVTTGSSGGSCPFVYVKTSEGFVVDNTILTQSEDPANRGQIVTDFYKLQYYPEVTNGSIDLDVREIEFERSYLDRLSLLLVEVPDDLDLAFSSNGDNAYISPEAQCLSTVTTDEADITDLVTLYDSETYIGYGPLYINVNIPEDADYDDLLVNVHLNKESANNDGTGTKLSHIINKPNGLTDTFTPMKLMVSSEKDGILELAAAPRVYPSTISYKIPRDFVRDGMITLSWQTKLDIDRIEITPALRKEVIIREIMPHSASFNDNEIDPNDILSADGKFVNLMPTDIIRLTFTDIPDAPVGYHYEFVFRSTGYYTSFDDQQDHTMLPETPELFQNYPNPFNPITVIPFSLPQTGKVRIDVINILGQHVRTLWDDEASAGYNTVQWNSRNDSGSPVASGIYFVRLQYAEHVRTMCLQLVK